MGLALYCQQSHRSPSWTGSSTEHARTKTHKLLTEHMTACKGYWNIKILAQSYIQGLLGSQICQISFAKSSHVPCCHEPFQWCVCISAPSSSMLKPLRFIEKMQHKTNKQTKIHSKAGSFRLRFITYFVSF